MGHRVGIPVSLFRWPEVIGLPSVTAQLGFLHILSVAADRDFHAGTFPSLRILKYEAYPYFRYVKHYLAAGLLEPSESLCKDCRADFPDEKPGSFVVHGWFEYFAAVPHTVRRASTEPLEADYEAVLFQEFEALAEPTFAWRQFKMGRRRADIVVRLAGSNTWLVVELKREAAGNHAVDQLVGYADWLAAELPDANIRAVLVAPDLRTDLPSSIEFLRLGDDPAGLIQ